MNLKTPSSSSSRPSAGDFAVAVALAKLLQRLELSGVPVAPAQYRAVAERLREAMLTVPPGDGLNALLAAFPAAAELYENQFYEHAGLCRSPLEAALNAELKAREVIERAARRRSA